MGRGPERPDKQSTTIHSRVSATRVDGKPLGKVEADQQLFVFRDPVMPEDFKTSFTHDIDVLYAIRPESQPPSVLLDQLKQRDRTFVTTAVRLAWRGAVAKDAVPELIVALSDDGTSKRNVSKTDGGQAVRAASAEALGQIGPAAKDAVPRLTELLTRDQAAEVRWHAAMALGKIGAAARDALPALEKIAATTDDARLKRFAQLSIHQIESAPPPEDEPAK